MPIQFQVGKLPDKTIIETFEALQAAFGVEHCSYQGGEIIFNDSLDLLKAKKTATYILTEANFRTKDPGFNVRIHRDFSKPNSIYFDDITISPKGGPDAAALLALEDVIRSKIRMPSLKTSPTSDSDVSGLLEKEMQTIASMHEKLLADALELRKNYELQDIERKSVFEKEKSEAEATIRQQQEDSLSRIAEEKQQLDEKRKEFDFSDHMRARRQLRENITTQVEGFLLRPVSTGFKSSKFMLVVIICLVAAIGAGIFAFESFQAFLSASNGQTQITTPYLMWVLALRGIVLTGVAIGFIAYLISMLRKSFDEDVRNQRELQHYGMDINRASWVIETAMEMTTKEGASLPDKWVEGAVYGLFQYGPKSDGDTSSLAALGAIMGLGPEVSVGPGGASFKIPPKGAKKAAKDDD